MAYLVVSPILCVLFFSSFWWLPWALSNHCRYGYWPHCCLAGIGNRWCLFCPFGRTKFTGSAARHHRGDWIGGRTVVPLDDYQSLINEARSGLILSVTILCISLLSYSAAAGMIAGGIWDLAIRYGYYRYQTEVMILSSWYSSSWSSPFKLW